MRRAHRLVLASWLTICGLVLMAAVSGAAADLTPGDDACALLGDMAALPVEAGAQGPGDCAAILKCRFEAREAAGLEEAETSALTMEEACERVGRVLSLTEPQAQKLALAVPDSAPPGCRQFLGCIANSLSGSASASKSTLHEAAPQWKAEFDRICAQVPIAGSLEVEELQQLIVDTDELIVALKGSDIPQAKLFVQRLERCRSFFEYSIELLAGETDPESGPQL